MGFFSQVIGRGVGLIVLLSFSSGCVSFSPNNNTATQSVRKVDFTKTPELKDWAAHARKLGDEVYPKLVAMLTDDPAKAPRQFDIVFTRKLAEDYPGITVGKTVYLDANRMSSFARNPTNFDMLLVHEMAHVAHAKFFLSFARSSPSYWVEGVADYARYKLGYTNGWCCPQCGDLSPHYLSGYECAGAFLLYVDAVHGSNVVHQLAAAVRRGTYSDRFFAEATGKTLAELWSDFQKTPAYMPGASYTYAIHQAFGYVNGRAPKDASARAISYLKKKPGGMLTLDAGKFLAKLVEQEQLPGVTAAERVGKSFSLGVEPVDMVRESESNDFPATRKWFGRYDYDAAKVHYLVVRSAPDQPWQLQRAWRANEDGSVLQEYAIELKSPRTKTE